MRNFYALAILLTFSNYLFAESVQTILGVNVVNYDKAVKLVKNELEAQGLNVDLTYPVSQATGLYPRNVLCSGPFAYGKVELNAVVIQIHAHVASLKNYIPFTDASEQWECQATILHGWVFDGPIRCQSKKDSRTIQLKSNTQIKRGVCVS